MTAVIPFGRPSYCAKLCVETLSGLDVRIAGTLDGYIDLAIRPVSTPNITYSLSCDDARQLIAMLHSVISDIQGNCLFDRDPLLRDRV